MVKRGLGSGLSALLENNSDTLIQDKVELISVQQIVANEDQPRKFFDPDKLEELSNSIREQGIIQPILVQKKNEKYMIVAGERRYRASILAGLSEVPCIIKNYTPKDLVKISLLENIQRENLNPIEEADSYDKIMKEFNITQELLAKELGKSRTYISNSVRLLKLPEKIKQYIVDGKLSYTHARTLITIDSQKEQERLAEDIVNGKLNVRETEKLTSKKSTRPKKRSAEHDEIIKILKNYLGTKVEIQNSKIEIRFFGQEDLERIAELIVNFS